MKLLALIAVAIFPLTFAVGGAQQYAEDIKAFTMKHGAPPHPVHLDRDVVRTGETGHAGPFNVSTTAPMQTFTHFFENSVGSGHMSLTAREDWRTHIRMAARDLGVKHIRGHGLLDDDMSVSYAYGKHAFYNIDSLVELLLSIGMRPIFELSFMPDWLASGPNQVCHYKGNTDPPKNYSEWGELIGALGSHMVSKYGEEISSEFLFEVWNEPNDQFWRGGEAYGPTGFSKQSSYFELYKHAALALKAASPKLQVGGPATCCASCWLKDFVVFMDNNSIPYDFISTHAYSSGPLGALGDVGRVVKEISAAMSDLKNVTSGDHPNHPAGKTPPWIITEFGDTSHQGFGNEGSPFFPSAIHDMIDQSSYTVAAVAQLAGTPAEPQALSYWAISDVFEESFFPVHNESFHGMFGLINLHGIPKPSYRAYQLLHETGTERLQVQGPEIPTPPVPAGTCSAPVNDMDVFGGDIAPPISPCPTCTLFTMADCCDLCLRQNDAGKVCDTAVLWHTSGQEGLGNRCGLKVFDKATKLTKNPGRSYVRVARTPSPAAPSNDELCKTNAGVLAVRNGTDAIDIFVYNHASYDTLIVDCTVTVNVVASNLATATVRRIDETHANPLATWIAMGAPDYTTAAQNAALLASSQLVVEQLSDVADVGENSFEIKVPTHGVAAGRIML
jgi:xylan 1,4-beta-xylosidase